MYTLGLQARFWSCYVRPWRPCDPAGERWPRTREASRARSGAALAPIPPRTSELRAVGQGADLPALAFVASSWRQD